MYFCLIYLESQCSTGYYLKPCSTSPAPSNTAGDEFNIVIDHSVNNISFIKRSTGQTYYTTFMDPTETRIWFGFGNGNGNGTLTLDYSPTQFMGLYDSTMVSYSGYDITYNGTGTIYSPTLDQFV